MTQSCFVAGETRPLSRARGRLTKGSDKGRSASRQGDQHSVLLCEGELVLAPHRIPLQGRGHTSLSQGKPSRQHVTTASPTLNSHVHICSLSFSSANDSSHHLTESYYDLPQGIGFHNLILMLFEEEINFLSQLLQVLFFTGIIILISLKEIGPKKLNRTEMVERVARRVCVE